MDGDPDLPQLDGRLDNGPNVGENKDDHLDEEKWRKHSQMFPHLPILLDPIQPLFTRVLLSYDIHSHDHYLGYFRSVFIIGSLMGHWNKSPAEMFQCSATSLFCKKSFKYSNFCKKYQFAPLEYKVKIYVCLP